MEFAGLENSGGGSENKIRISLDITIQEILPAAVVVNRVIRPGKTAIVENSLVPGDINGQGRVMSDGRGVLEGDIQGVKTNRADVGA